MSDCSKCGDAPRMVSKSGVELSRCADCQRDYWRTNKRQNPSRTAKPKRSPTPKPRIRSGTPAQMPGSKPLTGEVIRQPIKPTLVFIDRANGRYVLCEVVSETPIDNPATIQFVSEFYRRLGYRIVDAVELMTSEQAGD